MQKGGQKQKEGGKTVDNKEKQIKELLEVLEKALKSEAVERITITIKPNQNLSSPKSSGGGIFPPTAFIISTTAHKVKKEARYGNSGKGKL